MTDSRHAVFVHPVHNSPTGCFLPLHTTARKGIKLHSHTSRQSSTYNHHGVSAWPFDYGTVGSGTSIEKLPRHRIDIPVHMPHVSLARQAPAGGGNVVCSLNHINTTTQGPSLVLSTAL